MSLVNLQEAIALTARKSALVGFVCLGYEDARAYVKAAELENSPAILMVGPGARGAMALEIWGAMLTRLAQEAHVPLVVHLDHGRDLAECQRAAEAGFSSLMFDGSRLSLEENIAQTKAVADYAHARGLSCEGEIGFVGYDAGEESEGTDPEEAAIFAQQTGVDAMAVSVGNVHLQKEAHAALDVDRVKAIAKLTDTPLVIHGGSGVAPKLRAELGQAGLISKFNIGTEMRQVFGRSLREALADPNRFDRLEIFREMEPEMILAARNIIQNLSGRAGS